MLKKTAQKLIYRDPWLEFFQDEVEFPSGKKGTYAWAKRKNGVGVVVVTEKNRIFLHREHRYVINDYSWEIQGGGIEDGESPVQAAVRELREEAGFVVQESRLVRLGSFYPLHSFNTEHVTLFMVKVREDARIATTVEDGESIDVWKFVSFAEALSMIDKGEINDAFTANAIQMAVRKALGKS